MHKDKERRSSFVHHMLGSLMKDLPMINSIQLVSQQTMTNQMKTADLLALLTNIFPFALLHIHQELIKTGTACHDKGKKNHYIF